MTPLLAPTEMDREQLIQFMRDLYELLDDLINTGSYQTGNRLISEELQTMFQPAWSALKVQLPLLRAESMINNATDERLVSAGLYGEQLKLKLSLVERFKNKFLQFATPKWLKKLLEIIDKVLKSILEATSMDGAIEELKSMLEISLDDDEDETNEQ